MQCEALTLEFSRRTVPICERMKGIVIDGRMCSPSFRTHAYACYPHVLSLCSSRRNARIFQGIAEGLQQCLHAGSLGHGTNDDGTGGVSKKQAATAKPVQSGCLFSHSVHLRIGMDVSIVTCLDFLDCLEQSKNQHVH